MSKAISKQTKKHMINRLMSIQYFSTHDLLLALLTIAFIWHSIALRLDWQLYVPRTNTKTLGPRGFYYASSAVWNSLPADLHDPGLSLHSFLAGWRLEYNTKRKPISLYPDIHPCPYNNHNLSQSLDESHNSIQFTFHMESQTVVWWNNARENWTTWLHMIVVYNIMKTRSYSIP